MAEITEEEKALALKALGRVGFSTDSRKIARKLTFLSAGERAAVMKLLDCKPGDLVRTVILFWQDSEGVERTHSSSTGVTLS